MGSARVGEPVEPRAFGVWANAMSSVSVREDL